MLNIQEQVDLSTFNTMRLNAKADFFTKLDSNSDIKEALNFSKQNDLPHLVLGGGSNILFVSNFPGLVMLNQIKGYEIISEDEDQILLKIGAGESWHKLVLYCVEQNYGGIENLSLIPGTVGAAPIQNIGAYGVELKDVFDSLEALVLETRELVKFELSECKFGYRDSIFKRELRGKVIITSVTLRLSKVPVLNFEYSSLNQKLEEWGIDKPTIRDVSEAVIEIRKSKLPDPEKIGNTGSFFKNPIISVSQYEKLKMKYSELPSYRVSEQEVKIPAGWLIEQAGWKGKRFGDAGVHDRQALVLVNHGKTTGNEIWSLAQKIMTSIRDKFGINLTPEVNISL